ncbi:hypothetical protein CYMTET_49504 [Cymbomonas tetramitiformis]|uniref:Uncharacterized protein n=1 Tax=Cymbomonas tetramitiformis TaxID=36881 RepID=A0AAE0BPY8_9CHLO|nr:hypothetical protein CYMTET_49504 [Cymbomonas tetramitiformis]
MPLPGTLAGNLDVQASVDSRGKLLRGNVKVRWKSRYCAVVGNSGNLLLGSPLGGLIDAHDVVLRMNTAPLITERTGNKTTFRLLNKAAAIAYAGKTNRPGPRTCRQTGCPLSANETLVLARGDKLVKEGLSQRFRSLELNLSAPAFPPGVGVAFLRSRVLAWTKQTLSATKRGECEEHRGVADADSIDFLRDSRYRTGLQKCQTMTAARAMREDIPKGKTPSIGLLAMLMGYSICKKVRLFGFGLDGLHDYQYFRMRIDPNVKDHDFQQEIDFLRVLSHGRRLRLCSNSSVAYALCSVPGHRLQPDSADAPTQSESNLEAGGDLLSSADASGSGRKGQKTESRDWAQGGQHASSKPSREGQLMRIGGKRNFSGGALGRESGKGLKFSMRTEVSARTELGGKGECEKVTKFKMRT